MAWAPDYCTAAELKTHLRIADSADDTPLGIAITAASRAVDLHCNRQFGVLSAAAARYYGWDGLYIDGRQALAIEDLQSTTNLAVLADDGNDFTFDLTLTNSTDFDLYPFNAVADGEPWTHIVMRPGAALWLPKRPRTVEVTALWGWTAVPSAVKQAALIQAARFFMRRESQYGIAGSPDLGNEMRLLDRLDPDVALLLRTVKRHWGAA